ncbi:MAG: hypothetical protein F6K28_39200 [Microcoleus sp. SIO2G3]|nr:hypothetical protein [Microcoleus sp. SIO2G3]
MGIDLAALRVTGIKIKSSISKVSISIAPALANSPAQSIDAPEGGGAIAKIWQIKNSL